MKCPVCGKGQLKRETRPVDFIHRKKKLVVDQPGEWCDRCGEGILSAEDLAATRRARHDAIARSQSLLTSGEIVKVREKLGLTQARAAKLFGGGVNGFSRYERGETVQPRAVDIVLRMISDDPKALTKIIRWSDRVPMIDVRERRRSSRSDGARKNKSRSAPEKRAHE